MDVEEIKDICRSRGLPTDKSKSELINLLVSDNSYAQAYEEAVEEAATNPGKVKKYREITITTIDMKPIEFTPGGTPQVSAAILKKMAGSNLFGDEKEARYGSALGFFGDNDDFFKNGFGSSSFSSSTSFGGSVGTSKSVSTTTKTVNGKTVTTKKTTIAKQDGTKEVTEEVIENGKKI